MEFKEFLELTNICEGVSFEDGELVFNYKDNDKGISTKMGKGKTFTPFVMTSTKMQTPVYSVYNVKGTSILKAIKANKANSEDYRIFLKRTAIFIAARMLKDIKPDVIITPASTSYILNDLIDELKGIVPHIKFLSEKFRKVLDPSKIKIDYDNPKITDKIIKSLESSIRRAKKEGYFQIKWLHKSHTKFITNYFDLVDDYKYKKLHDKNVVLLDDVLSSGATIEEMIRIIKQYSPSKVTGITIFKTK